VSSSHHPHLHIVCIVVHLFIYYYAQTSDDDDEGGIYTATSSYVEEVWEEEVK